MYLSFLSVLFSFAISTFCNLLYETERNPSCENAHLKRLLLLFAFKVEHATLWRSVRAKGGKLQCAFRGSKHVRSKSSLFQKKRKKEEEFRKEGKQTGFPTSSLSLLCVSGRRLQLLLLQECELGLKKKRKKKHC